VRILILSDIHSNLEALEACLEGAPPYEVVVNLGDLVGYGASPNEVVARARGLGEFFVRGNHDKAAVALIDVADFNPMAGVAALWTRNQLTHDNLTWLRALPQGPRQLEGLPGVQFVHGSPLNEDEYVINVRDAIYPLAASSAPLTFFGHTHLQGSFLLKDSSADGCAPSYQTVGQAEMTELRLKEGFRYMVNPGSVGQPRDGDWRAAFALFDSETRIVTFCRVPYNLHAAQERILAANLPQRLATRLAAGR
jgi:diadenosine tetraphosphatase ApaH/serine/threonine PP2A family protein phosphatase